MDAGVDSGVDAIEEAGVLVEEARARGGLNAKKRCRRPGSVLARLICSSDVAMAMSMIMYKCQCL